MNFNPGSLRTLAIMALTVAVAGGAMVFAGPRPVSSDALGVGWTCSRTAFVVTTCAPTERQTLPATDTSSRNSIRRQPPV